MADPAKVIISLDGWLSIESDLDAYHGRDGLCALIYTDGHCQGKSYDLVDQLEQYDGQHIRITITPA